MIFIILMTKTILLAITVAFLAGTLVSGAVVFADGEKLTKLTKECSKEPKSADKIKAHCELLNLINAIELIPGPQGEPGPAGSLDVSIKYVKLFDDANGNAKGWDPDEVTHAFNIDDDDITEDSIVNAYIRESSNTLAWSFNVLSKDLGCSLIILSDTDSADFRLAGCNVSFVEPGAILKYSVINPIP